MTKIYIYFGTMVCWYSLLQIVLAWISGAIGQEPKSICIMVYETKCWAVLMGMITSNSTMSFWALVQIEADKRVGVTDYAAYAGVAVGAFVFGTMIIMKIFFRIN